MSASSNSANNGDLRLDPSGAWTPYVSDNNQYLQAGYPVPIYAIRIETRGDKDQKWVGTYTVQYRDEESGAYVDYKVGLLCLGIWGAGVENSHDPGKMYYMMIVVSGKVVCLHTCAIPKNC